MKKSRINKPQIDSALSSFDALPDSAKVRVRVVAALEGCCVATVWRRTRLGLLPRPEKIGNTTVWRVGDLRQMWALRKIQGVAHQSRA
jgi:predicted DNA-binding transcriptional regulator AlpA